MKKILLSLLLVFVILLWGCYGDDQNRTAIQISLMDIPGCTVENNGLWVEPGEDAVFRLSMDEGYSIANTDYEGAYSYQLKDGYLELTLKDVTYPARVSLDLTQDYAIITYDANGGTGDQVVMTYDLTYHIRPNTSIGTDIFTREGYTLTSWNTEPDGSGTRVGLGSRVTPESGLTLYAQWAEWTDAEDFEYTVTPQNTVTINAYLGNAETLVIPERIDGTAVTTVAAGAFEDGQFKHVILPTTMRTLAPDCFENSALETITVYDNIVTIMDNCFPGCDNLQTLYINAIEAPYGYEFRKESIYADKVDVLIMAQGQKKMVFYAGCSVWYNLDGPMADEAFGEEYTIINLGLNGTVNSTSQMQIMGAYLEEGDVLVHSLEIASQQQLLITTEMTATQDNRLWCGIEYNYDLFTLVDLRTMDGVFTSWCDYLQRKDSESSYMDIYTDPVGRYYLDEYGGIPFERNTTVSSLADRVFLDPTYIDTDAMARLEEYYNWFQDMGVTVYATYSCINMDEVPAMQQNNAQLMDDLFHEAFDAMDGPVLVSTLLDYLYVREDFFDTNYHLQSIPARENTSKWIRDLMAQMVIDGLMEGA